MVELREITEDNYGECFKLKVTEAQNNFVASNIYSLAQARVFYETAYPFAVYADGGMVGFIMLGYLKPENQYTVWRLMIDERFQGKGYGRQALLLGIEYLKEKFGPPEIFLSYEPDNHVAEKLYESVGFKKTGGLWGDEIIMRLNLKS